ncbi:22658_t:CDS:2, partial [Racocetra persica]
DPKLFNIESSSTKFTVSKLLNDDEMGKEFEGGSLGIFRLAPQDYHRFHIPVDGQLSEPVEISGDYYTVNPMAIRSELDVYCLNKRSISYIDSPQFGKVAYVSIGAMMVGSIILTSKPNTYVKRFDEHGYFAFGGSTVVLLFKKGRMLFDEDILDNSKQPLETL